MEANDATELIQEMKSAEVRIAVDESSLAVSSHSRTPALTHFRTFSWSAS